MSLQFLSALGLFLPGHSNFRVHGMNNIFLDYMREQDETRKTSICKKELSNVTQKFNRNGGPSHRWAVVAVDLDREEVRRTLEVAPAGHSSRAQD